ILCLQVWRVSWPDRRFWQFLGEFSFGRGVSRPDPLGRGTASEARRGSVFLGVGPGCEDVGAVAELPTGTVTLLFTDIDRSTELVRRLQERYGQALAVHRALLRAAFAEHGGAEV